MDKNAFQKLDELEQDSYSQDARDILKSWREALNQIEIDKAFATLKNTKDIMAAAQDRVATVEKKLLEERKMSSEDREYLLGVKDSMKTLLYWFDAGGYESRQKAIEAAIDENIKGNS